MKLPSDTPLSPSMIKEAEAAMKMGVPRPMASFLASRPSTGSQRYREEIQKSGPHRPRQNRPLSPKGARSGATVVGKGLPRGGRRKSFDFTKHFKKKKKKSAPKDRLWRFADKASKRADIHSKDANLFDIISYRYKVLAPQRLLAP